MPGSSGVFYLDGVVNVDVIDGGVRLTGSVPEPVNLAVVSLNPALLFRVAACLMVAAHDLTCVKTPHLDGVRVPH